MNLMLPLTQPGQPLNLNQGVELLPGGASNPTRAAAEPEPRRRAASRWRDGGVEVLPGGVIGGVMVALRCFPVA
jgi:hypothetical protein